VEALPITYGMEEEDKEEKPRRITNTTAILMLASAGLVDLLQLLLTVAGGVGLVLNTFVAVFAGFCFWLWFKLKGVGFISDPKRFLTLMAESIGEVIPALNNLPIFLAGAIITIILTRIEDKTSIKVPIPGKGGKLALDSSRTNTFKGNRALINRQNARRTDVGLNESPRIAPTLQSSSSANLRGSQAILKRQASRRMDIGGGGNSNT